jgi:hypothetical protein
MSQSIKFGWLPLVALALLANNAGYGAEKSGIKGNLLVAGEAVEKLINGQPLAIIATRSATDADPVNQEQANYLAKQTMAALLRAGIRGMDAEIGHPLTVTYNKGKLAGELLFGEADATYWNKEKKAAFVLQSIMTPGKTGARLRWRLFDLATMRPLKSIDLPPISDEELTSKSDFTFLPEMNIKLLLFAGDNIGKPIDRGECWDLPAHCLKANGFRVPGYNFGKEVPIAEALPGDVLSNDTNGNHHVMLLVKPTAELSGALIYHQNTNNRRFVVCDDFPSSMRKGILVWRPGAPQ